MTLVAALTVGDNSVSVVGVRAGVHRAARELGRPRRSAGGDGRRRLAPGAAAHGARGRRLLAHGHRDVQPERRADLPDRPGDLLRGRPADRPRDRPPRLGPPRARRRRTARGAVRARHVPVARRRKGRRDLRRTAPSSSSRHPRRCDSRRAGAVRLPHGHDTVRHREPVGDGRVDPVRHRRRSGAPDARGVARGARRRLDGAARRPHPARARAVDPPGRASLLGAGEEHRGRQPAGDPGRRGLRLGRGLPVADRSRLDALRRPRLGVPRRARDQRARHVARRRPGLSPRAPLRRAEALLRRRRRWPSSCRR